MPSTIFGEITIVHLLVKVWLECIQANIVRICDYFYSLISGLFHGTLILDMALAVGINVSLLEMFFKSAFLNPSLLSAYFMYTTHSKFYMTGIDL